MKIFIIILFVLCVYCFDSEYYYYNYDEPYCAFVNDKSKEYILANRFYRFVNTNEYISPKYKYTFQIYFYGADSPLNSLQDELNFRTNVYEFKKKYSTYRRIKSLNDMDNPLECDT